MQTLFLEKFKRNFVWKCGHMMCISPSPPPKTIRPRADPPSPPAKSRTHFYRLWAKIFSVWNPPMKLPMRCANVNCHLIAMSIHCANLKEGITDSGHVVFWRIAGHEQVLRHTHQIRHQLNQANRLHLSIVNYFKMQDRPNIFKFGLRPFWPKLLCTEIHHWLAKLLSLAAAL